MATRNFFTNNQNQQENEDSNATENPFQGYSPNANGNDSSNKQPSTTVQGVQTVRPIDAPSRSAEISELIKNGGLNGSPYFDQIKKNMERRTILTTMPVKESNGRAKSGLHALIEGLGTYFDPKFGLVKNWGELAARGAGAAGRAAGGLINPEWDEEAEKQKEIARIDQENDKLLDVAQRDWQMRQQSAVFGLNQQKEINRQANAQTNADLRGRSLDLREARQNYQKLNGEQKTVLSAIFKRGYYKEGANKNEDAQLARLEIVLPDFDTRKPITKEQAGKFQQWDYETETWKDAPGMPVDESEVPIEYSIRGQRMKLRPRDIAMIEAGKERQETQNNFVAGENDKNRALRKELQQNAQQYGREQTVKKAVDAWIRLYYKENGTNPSEDEINNYKTYVGTQIDTPEE